MFNPEEIRAWEASVEERIRKRLFQPKGNPRDPRQKAMLKHRRRGLVLFKESKPARKIHQRHFRMRTKQHLLREEDWAPVPHDYKTYGRMTW